MWQRLALPEISSDLTETTFFIGQWKNTSNPKDIQKGLLFFNGSYPVIKCFELQNEPQWVFHSYSTLLCHFRRISPKTTVMGQNVAFSEISSDLTEMTFFRQTS